MEPGSAWIAECGRPFERCIEQSSQRPAADVCQAFEILFGLLRLLSRDPDRVIFFADEGGAWQVDVPWPEVLPYLSCSSRFSPVACLVTTSIGVQLTLKSS